MLPFCSAYCAVVRLACLKVSLLCICLTLAAPTQQTVAQSNSTNPAPSASAHKKQPSAASLQELIPQQVSVPEQRTFFKEYSLKGHFEQDSTKIGMPVVYTLLLKHPAGTQAVFPDSGYDYSPFELAEKQFFPTRTLDNISTDSVRFTLQTFSLDSVQQLALPVWVSVAGDSVELQAAPDSLRLVRVIKVPQPDAVPVATTVFGTVPPRFNYPYWILGTGAAVILLVLLNAFIGKPAQRYWKLILLLRRQRLFLLAFDRLQAQTLRDKSGKRMEASLNLWKTYIERTDGKPYTTYTTKEMATAIPDEQLVKTLQAIDRCVYGGQTELISEEIFKNLRSRANLFYQKKQLEIRNA